jgi:hypothetical protein
MIEQLGHGISHPSMLISMQKRCELLRNAFGECGMIK